MDIDPRLSLVAAALLVVALVACGDDDESPTGGGPNDDTAPVVASVTPVDDHHIDVTFDERVTKATAEDESNYSLTEATLILRGPNAAPGDPYFVGGATLSEDEKTVRLATVAPMAGLNFDIVVHGVSDVTGNVIGEEGSARSFTASSTPDETAPTVVSHAPTSNAINVVVNPTIVVNFSEAVQSVTASLSSGGGPVSIHQIRDGATLTIHVTAPLDYYVTYTVSVKGTDFAGNVPTLPTTWTFTTKYNY